LMLLDGRLGRRLLLRSHVQRWLYQLAAGNHPPRSALNGIAREITCACLFAPISLSGVVSELLLAHEMLRSCPDYTRVLCLPGRVMTWPAAVE
jgi:hypothetical protein